MQHEDVKKWIKDLPSCLEVRERHLDPSWETRGRCGACGRVSGHYQIHIRAGDELKVLTDKNDIVIALIHNGDLIVFREPETKKIARKLQ
ncbi:unnamed protein product [marine sediment metagenome]|uniref:Uncharacterized protein n=1 Tax=marine sediment metagenome TaxID=412755 RepID=X1JKR3_9ZZZZ